MKLMDMVVELEGKSDHKRRDIILEKLRKLGYNYFLESYRAGLIDGYNIIFEHGKGEKEIIVSSHYDVVPSSPGANDNASSVSVMLDVYRRLKSYKPNNRIRMIIFDDEEPTSSIHGCLGSKEYVMRNGIGNLLAVYNLELCGMGDVVGIWPVTNEVRHSYALTNLKDTMKKLGIYFEEAARIPGFYADHRSFRELGFKHAFTLTAVLKEEKDMVRKYAELSLFPLLVKMIMANLFSSYRMKIPKLFQHYHTSEDKSEYLSEDSLKMMSDVVYNSVINLDKKFR